MQRAIIQIKQRDWKHSWRKSLLQICYLKVWLPVKLWINVDVNQRLQWPSFGLLNGNKASVILFCKCLWKKNYRWLAPVQKRRKCFLLEDIWYMLDNFRLGIFNLLGFSWLMYCAQKLCHLNYNKLSPCIACDECLGIKHNVIEKHIQRNSQLWTWYLKVCLLG